MKMKMKFLAGIMTLLFMANVFASASVNVYAETVTTIEIEANPTTLLIGETTTLSSEGFDENGTSMGDVTKETTFYVVDPFNATTVVGPVEEPNYTVWLPGVYEITGVYGTDEISDTTKVIARAMTISKELVGGSETPPQFVPIFTNVWFDLSISLENPDDVGEVNLTSVVLKDGIGADLDLVVQSDNGSDYIFTLNGENMFFDDGDDNAYYGEVGPISWKQASDKAFSKGKRCATIVTWNVDELADNSSAVLDFRVETNTFETKKHVKQSYTSTCHKELNDGPEVTYSFSADDDLAVDTVIGEPVIVSAYDPNPDEYGNYPDSDNDGIPDVDEVAAGTDPCDPQDYPSPIEEQ
jgi:hypothetical protein